MVAGRDALRQALLAMVPQIDELQRKRELMKVRAPTARRHRTRLPCVPLSPPLCSRPDWVAPPRPRPPPHIAHMSSTPAEHRPPGPLAGSGSTADAAAGRYACERPGGAAAHQHFGGWLVVQQQRRRRRHSQGAARLLARREKEPGGMAGEGGWGDVAEKSAQGARWGEHAGLWRVPCGGGGSHPGRRPPGGALRSDVGAGSSRPQPPARPLTRSPQPPARPLTRSPRPPTRPLTRRTRLRRRLRSRRPWTSGRGT